MGEYPVVFILAASFVLGALASALDDTAVRRPLVSKFALYAVAAATGCAGGVLLYRNGPVWLAGSGFVSEEVFVGTAGLAFSALILVWRRVWYGRGPRRRSP